VHLLTAQLMRF